jgi:hypothetical protein
MGIRANRLWPILTASLWLGIAPAAQFGAPSLRAASAPVAPAETPAPQRSFASSEDAVNAFIAALRDNREADLRAILGPEADRIIDSGDKYADRELHARFLALYEQKHAIKPAGPGQAELDVGPDDWPLPIPLVQTDGRWTFDTAAGAEMIVDRRIGRNELSAIRTLLACVDAQQDYFDRTKQQTGTGVYATRFISTQGHHDGLYWQEAAGEAESPLGPLIDTAQDAGYPGELTGGKPIPYEGYNFRILRSQGPNGNGGSKSYIRSGRMTAGFAFVAWPAVYKSSGIMTFIAGPDGDVYQKDLGAETTDLVTKLSSFDPDLTWSRVAVTNE